MRLTSLEGTLACKSGTFASGLMSMRMNNLFCILTNQYAREQSMGRKYIFTHYRVDSGTLQLNAMLPGSTQGLPHLSCLDWCLKSEQNSRGQLAHAESGRPGLAHANMSMKGVRQTICSASSPSFAETGALTISESSVVAGARMRSSSI